jgi:hypothetical protein
VSNGINGCRYKTNGETGSKGELYQWEELGNIIFDQLKLDSFPFCDDPKTPDEFKTDEWWKKRNL